MKLGSAGAAMIKAAEGCRMAAYPDPGTGNAPWTIGWGHTGPDVSDGLVWTQAQCDARFDRDVADRLQGLTQALGNASTTQNHFDALFSLAYNIGLRNFLQSSVLRFHHRGLHHDAAAAFGAWNKGCGRVLPGLVARRAKEAALYLAPEEGTQNEVHSRYSDRG